MRELFSLRTVRSKIVMMTKAAGVILILSYFASKKLPFSEDVSSLIWAVFIVVLTLILDALLGRCITRPVAKLCEQAQKTAQLDFSGACAVTTADEFGSLADSLNQMAKNLQGTLARLEAANAQLEKRVQQEHQLLEERKEIVDHLSHEMKTPLGVIRAYAEGLQDETDAQTKQSYAGVIIAETERMSTLITTLLDLSALENGAARLVPEQFDFVELFETEAGRLLIDVPEPYFSLEYELPPQRVFVLADRARMGQVLDNLIVNAKKNVVKDGVIHLSCALQNDRLHVSIYNQCAPIPDDMLSKIWDKFYRGADADYSGSGLGLAIAAQILSMHDLSYSAQNCPGGVAFSFSVPSVPQRGKNRCIGVDMKKSVC